MLDLGIASVTPPRGDGWSVRFRCGCHVYLYGREWLIWSLGRHALGRRCDAHSSRVRALGDTSVVHGQSCAKAPHTGDGYLHGAGDDAPYTVDGAEYCGRCHVAMGGMEVGRG